MLKLYKQIKLLLLFILIFIPLVSFADTVSLKKDIDAVINQAIQEKRLVGAVVLISQDGKLIYKGIFGWRDREAKIPMTEDTIFRLASFTKPVTSTLILKLIDQKKLNLDDPVTKWIPDFQPKTADGKIPVITIRQLLMHTAGLDYSFFEPVEGPYHQLQISDGLNIVPFSLAENVKRISKAPLLFTPGTAWHYSLATDVLGEVIQNVQHTSLPNAMNQIIFKPLKIKNTGFLFLHNTLLATPYMNTKSGAVRMAAQEQKIPFGLSFIRFSPLRIFDKNAYPSGGAGLAGTAADYMKFLESLRTGTINISKELLTDLTTNQTGDLPTLAGLGWGWSLGFAILKDPQQASSPQAKGTYAWGGVWGNSWWVDPENKLTVVILTNTAFEGMSGKLPTDIRDVLYRNIKNK